MIAGGDGFRVRRAVPEQGHSVRKVVTLVELGTSFVLTRAGTLRLREAQIGMEAARLQEGRAAYCLQRIVEGRGTPPLQTLDEVIHFQAGWFYNGGDDPEGVRPINQRGTVTWLHRVLDGSITLSPLEADQHFTFASPEAKDRFLNEIRHAAEQVEALKSEGRWRFSDGNVRTRFGNLMERLDPVYRTREGHFRTLIDQRNHHLRIGIVSWGLGTAFFADAVFSLFSEDGRGIEKFFVNDGETP